MASRDTKQPNLLFILTDDQGAWAMGCAGNAEIKSPNLDWTRRAGSEEQYAGRVHAVITV